MSRQIIELVQVLVDRIEKHGYEQRAREENAFDLNKRLTEAEGWVAHWKQARQEAHEAGELMRAEIETLKDEIKTLKVESSGLDQTAWYAEQDLEKAKAEIETLRKELADAKRAASDEFTERQVLTVEQQQDAAAWQQQVDSANAEVSYLRARLDEERSVSAGLRQQLRTAAGRVDLTEENNRSLREQLDAAQAAVTLQRAGIERLHKFVGTVRLAMWPEDIKSALTELDAGTEPTPVAETLDVEGGA